MNKGSLFALLLCGALLTTGCASKKQLETLRNENAALRRMQCKYGQPPQPTF